MKSTLMPEIPRRHLATAIGEEVADLSNGPQAGAQRKGQLTLPTVQKTFVKSLRRRPTEQQC